MPCDVNETVLLGMNGFELFGCICGNTNANETKLRTLPVGDRFELIPFTFALPWKEPNSTFEHRPFQIHAVKMGSSS